MKPGDLVTCSSCGTTATAYTTGDPARWQEGDFLLVSWGGYRHEAVRAAPGLCLFCQDGTRPRAKAPTRRVAIMDELALAGCRTDGFEWQTDALVEEAFQRWIAAGRPRCALVVVQSDAGEGPFRVEPGDRRGSSSSVQKAPLERPTPPVRKEQLALL